MVLYSAEINDKGQVVLSGGQVVNNFHDEGSCLGDHCPVHNPTDHKYRNLPLSFNGVNMLRNFDNGEITVDPDDYSFNSTGSAILSNSAQCLKCKDVIVSESIHDFQECSCKNIFVDGGLNYLRRGAQKFNKLKELSVLVTKE